MDILAVIASNLGRLTEAEQLFRQELEARMRVGGSDDPRTLLAMNNLGTNLSDQGRFAEAEENPADHARYRAQGVGIQNTRKRWPPLAIWQITFATRDVTRKRRSCTARRSPFNSVLCPIIRRRSEPWVTWPTCLLTPGGMPEAESIKRNLLEKYRKIYGVKNPETAVTGVRFGLPVGAAGACWRSDCRVAGIAGRWACRCTRCAGHRIRIPI